MLHWHQAKGEVVWSNNTEAVRQSFSCVCVLFTGQQPWCDTNNRSCHCASCAGSCSGLAAYRVNGWLRGKACLSALLPQHCLTHMNYSDLCKHTPTSPLSSWEADNETRLCPWRLIPCATLCHWVQDTGGKTWPKSKCNRVCFILEPLDFGKGIMPERKGNTFAAAAEP